MYRQSTEKRQLTQLRVLAQLEKQSVRIIVWRPFSSDFLLKHSSSSLGARAASPAARRKKSFVRELFLLSDLAGEGARAPGEEFEWLSADNY